MSIESVKTQRGHLVFFGKSQSDVSVEKAILKVVPGNYYHIGILDDENYLIHACSQGVLKEKLTEAVKRIEPEYIEICSLNVDSAITLKAVEKARNVVGNPYNDIFSSNYLNSEGKLSFYCSQLITYCFEEFNVPFPDHKMNFLGEDGKIMLFWINYYKERNQTVPQSQPGSHPSQIRRTPILTGIMIITISEKASR